MLLKPKVERENKPSQKKKSLELFRIEETSEDILNTYHRGQSSKQEKR